MEDDEVEQDIPIVTEMEPDLWRYASQESLEDTGSFRRVVTGTRRVKGGISEAQRSPLNKRVRRKAGFAYRLTS